MSGTENLDERATVLIVDDEATNIRVLNEILQNRYRLCFATDGEKALEIVANQEIDLVLLDVMMPGMDGYEVCRRLKADDVTRKIPVIFVTSMDEVEDETQGFSLGGADYITKPVSPPIVRARIKTHLAIKEQTDMLERLSTVDVLTKISNRRRFDEVLRKEHASAVRSRSRIALLIVDVDFFKQYNDTFGHTRGDECLTAVAGALQKACSRPTDLVARYGGEEFAIVLRENDLAGCCAVVQKIHTQIRDLELPHPRSAVAEHVTVSVGAVCFVPPPEMTPTDALEHADALLYEAKRSGRMRGICSDLDQNVKQTVTSSESDATVSETPGVDAR